MKKFVIAVAACVALGGVGTTNLVSAAPKDEVKQEKVQQQKGKQQENKQQNQNKGQLNQLKSIDKQLDNIEVKLKYYQTLLPKLEAPIEELQKDNIKSEEPTSTDETLTNIPVDAIEETETAQTPELEEDIDGVNEETTEDVEASEEDVETDLKKYPGYEGKFNALLNRLQSATNRLNSLSKKGVDSKELQTRFDRLDSLKEEIQKSMTALSSLQNKVKEEVNNDSNAEEKEAKEAVEENKEWTIQFSKGLDISSLSNLDIVVLDEEQKLVETTITYLEESNSVKISSAQPYESGKTYTLYIGNDISSENGLDLKNSVKMTFKIK